MLMHGYKSEILRTCDDNVGVVRVDSDSRLNLLPVRAGLSNNRHIRTHNGGGAGACLTNKAGRGDCATGVRVEGRRRNRQIEDHRENMQSYAFLKSMSF